MELVSIVFGQVALMCILMVAGGSAYHFKLINDDGVKQISNFLLYIVNPMTIICAYQTEFSFEKLAILGKTLLVGTVIMISALVIVSIFGKKYNSIEQFGIAFANSGFIGIPLVKAILGDYAIFHLSAFLVAYNLFFWTYGIFLITKDKKYMTLKKAIYNPGTIGTILGLILFISPIKFPNIIFNGLNTIGNLNTPLAMLVLGAYIVKSNPLSLFTEKRLYGISFIRLIVFPLIILVILKLLPISDYTILMTVFIANAGPSAVNTMIFSLQFGGDAQQGARIVSLTSMLSMLSLPIVIYISNFFLL